MSDMHRFTMFTLAAIAGAITGIVGIPHELGIPLGTYIVGCLKLTGYAWIAGASVGIIYWCVYTSIKDIKEIKEVIN